ncbi:MAG TPA: tetratricopeptide repeat protein [Acidisarcina sp.]|nr:tetratricopeptide repeat protein [Acidisarcina sp.]
MKRKTTLWLALVLLFIMPAFAQEPTAKIHGHNQDPVGAPMAKSTVKLSKDGAAKDVKYSFVADANGDYKGEGIAPGTYYITLDNAEGKDVDQFPNVKFGPGVDVLQDFDLGRPDYMSKLTPEQRKAAEELRKKNAEAMKENAQIKNLNATLKQARDDNRAKNYAEAETLMKQATTAKPDASVLWLELGTAQAGEKKNEDALTSLNKALELEAASKKPSIDIQGAANNTLGEVYANLGKLPESVAAYEAAAKIDPKGAAMYYTNSAIILDRTGHADETVVAADKAIAADPTRPISYYLKGKALVGKSTIEPKTGKLIAPPGCVEAYEKYLELAPNGPMAPEVKSILAEMSTQVKTTYKAPNKKK